MSMTIMHVVGEPMTDTGSGCLPPGPSPLRFVTQSLQVRIVHRRSATSSPGSGTTSLSLTRACVSGAGKVNGHFNCQRSNADQSGDRQPCAGGECQISTPWRHTWMHTCAMRRRHRHRRRHRLSTRRRRGPMRVSVCAKWGGAFLLYITLQPDMEGRRGRRDDIAAASDVIRALRWCECEGRASKAEGDTMERGRRWMQNATVFVVGSKSSRMPMAIVYEVRGGVTAKCGRQTELERGLERWPSPRLNGPPACSPAFALARRTLYTRQS
jgi:hypothetical protein